MSGVEVLIHSAAFGAFAAACLFVYALYLVADSLISRAVWKEDATRYAKAKTVARYTYEQAEWRKAPRTLFNGFAVGFGVSFVLRVFWNGLKATFL